MAESSSFSDVNAAFGLLSHLYLTPVLVTLIQGGVPDHLEEGPLPASDLARRAGMDALSLTRALRALAAFGAFQEVSPGVFANNTVSDLFRERPEESCIANARADFAMQLSSGVAITFYNPPRLLATA